MSYLNPDEVTILVREKYSVTQKAGIVGNLKFRGYVDHSGIDRLLEFLDENFYQNDAVRFEVKINSTN
jgi:hypothetical protein